jgi:D-alanine-D-alanine ligase-like ATP-grasp enzyme
MSLRRLSDPTSQRVAILYQALPPPIFAGLRKEPKPGGYSDSGADIGFGLRQQGIEVLTQVATPARDLDWVFPDTEEGIARALAAGATVLWANTILFDGHPLEAVLGQVFVVGQLPSMVQRVDDKFATNALLRARGLPVPSSVLVAREARPHVFSLTDLSKLCDEGHLSPPLVVKPVRGRGSQGVTLVEDSAALLSAADKLLSAGNFGDQLMVEQFLRGEELTVTVMPAGDPRHNDGDAWTLPPVRRFDHQQGIAPYNGTVPVSKNSLALTPKEQSEPAVADMLEACIKAAEIVGALAPIRIDCRADASGQYQLFDVNAKPNLTGAGRPGREDQDCLSALAARALGWSYGDLLKAMLAGAFQME